MAHTAPMITRERTVSLAVAVLYALVIGGGALLSGQVALYLPHAIILGVCCVAVPSMIHSLRSLTDPTGAARQ